MENNICCPVDADLKDRFNQIDTNDFYRVHDAVPLKKRALSISVVGLTLREGRPSHHPQYLCHLRNHPFVPK